MSTGIVALAKMGDKAQFATVALAAQYSSLWAVVMGTIAGMMLANAPACCLVIPSPAQCPCALCILLPRFYLRLLVCSLYLMWVRSLQGSESFDPSSQLD